MDKRSYWEDHNGKKILVNDYSNLSKEEIIDRIRLNQKLIPTLGNDLLLLVDVSDNRATPEIVNAFKEIAKVIRPYILKGAVVGVAGIQKIILITVNRFSDLGLVPFSTRKEALEYLTKT